MSALFFALPAEAKPWIEALEAKPEKKQGHFRYYHSENHSIIISGVGKIAMAMAVTEFAQKFKNLCNQRNFQIWNLGICGSANNEYLIGDFFWIHKIIDDSTGREYFPDRLEKIADFPETFITTFDKPVTKNPDPKNQIFKKLNPIESSNISLVDMESSAFFEAASIYFDLSQIHIGKVISDHLEGNLCSANTVSQLLKKHIPTLLPDFISEKEDADKSPLADEVWIHYKEHALSLNFTESMLVELKKSIIYFILKYPNEDIPKPQIPKLTRNFEKRDVKEYFLQWRQLLHV
ncbi:MAG: phosphorylase [Leptospira sp.]|nr:phosphorylase [Leptospira sp.]